MQADLDEAVSEVKNSEERAKKATLDASRLVEELRAEQDHALQVERLRKGLEQQVKDLQTRLAEPDGNSLKEGKRVIAKLEQRIHELENENKLEQHRHQETLKELRKKDRQEIAAINLTEFRKVQTELEEAAERTNLVENQLGKLRAKARSSVSVGRSTPANELRESTTTTTTTIRASSVRQRLIKTWTNI